MRRQLQSLGVERKLMKMGYTKADFGGIATWINVKVSKPGFNRLSHSNCVILYFQEYFIFKRYD